MNMNNIAVELMACIPPPNPTAEKNPADPRLP